MFPTRERDMSVEFDAETAFDGDFLLGWANVGKSRVRCRASRLAMEKLAGFSDAGTNDLHKRKSEAFELLKPTFTTKIQVGDFDGDVVTGVLVKAEDL